MLNVDDDDDISGGKKILIKERNAVIFKIIRTIWSRLYFGANWKERNDKTGQFHHRNSWVIVI